MKKNATRWFAGLVGAVAAIGAVSFIAQDADAQRQRQRAQATESQVTIGEKAPEFTLTDINGEEVAIMDFVEEGKIVVLEWWNPGCPYVVKHHDEMTTMQDLAEKFEAEVQWVKINSTNEAHQDYGLDVEYAEKWNVTETPILMDTDGKVGKMYGAQRTPQMYIIDAEGVLRYNGAIDSHSRSTKAPSESEKDSVINYVDQALQQIIDGETVTRPETRAYGCGVKYAN